MVREEAIKMLRGMKADNLNLDDLYTKDKYEALDMAIKALEQQPCEDCVSRQAVADFLRNHAKDFEDAKVRMAFKAASSLVENVNNIPSVTPTRKKGRWIDSEILGEFKCSCCGNYWQDAEENEYEDWVNIAKYCPNCGAEMESEE